MSRIKLMSNNIWYLGDNDLRWAEKGEDCSAEKRAKGFLKVYGELLPDVIGFQECTARLADCIMKGFSAQNLPYSLLWGRDTPIVYRRDKFELIESDFLLYPGHCPDFEGDFNNQETKSYCIAVLRKKDNGKLIVFASTHLWWKSSDNSSPDFQAYSDEAREYQLNLLIDKIENIKVKYDCPAVIVGDFNAEYQSLAVQSALKRGFKHAHEIAVEYSDETCGFHYCYPDGYDMFEDKKDFTYSIDHIILSGVKKGSVKRFERYYPDYYMPLSDHFPVWIEIDL